MPDDHSTTGSTGQNSAAAEHQEPPFEDQSKGGNPYDDNFSNEDEKRLKALQDEDAQLFQALYTAAGTAEHRSTQREKDKGADAVTAVAENGPQSLSDPDNMTTSTPSDAPNLSQGNPDDTAHHQ